MPPRNQAPDEAPDSGPTRILRSRSKAPAGPPPKARSTAGKTKKKKQVIKSAEMVEDSAQSNAESEAAESR